MNERINDGGYAFPVPIVKDHLGNNEAVSAYGPFGGLTKRELLAAMAMQGLLASDSTEEWSSDAMADYAVTCSDALLAALNQQPEATLPEHKEVR